MSEYQPHSSYETDRLPYTKTAGRRAVRIAIGQELSGRYKPPAELPHTMLPLLMQLNGPHDEK